MMAMSAVPMSERSSPVGKAGVKWAVVPVVAVNASRPSAASAPYLATVVTFMTTAALLTPT